MSQKEIFHKKFNHYKELLIKYKELLQFVRHEPKMSQKELFEYELEKANESGEKLSHISNELSIDELNDLDRMYGVANNLSLKNADFYRFFLKLLAIVGVILTLSFLLYDEWDLYWLMISCFFAIGFLWVIRKWANNSRSHKNYLEFRVLAESFRVQFFLSIAHINEKSVAEMLPWFIKKGPVWISEVLKELPIFSLNGDPKPILNFWIRNQLSYNEYAYKKKKKENDKHKMITRTAIIITVVVYAFAFFFEVYVLICSPTYFDLTWWRVNIKVILGVAATLTLFAESYYGKMALEDIIEDHSRMVELYKYAEQKVIHEGESSEVILDLAQEFLIENSTWYAYQNQNKPDLVL